MPWNEYVHHQMFDGRILAALIETFERKLPEENVQK
jgi:hypothetical protein